MTKQEEIRKGIEVALCGGMLLGTELYMEEGYCFLTEKYRKELTMRVLNWQNAKGVATKVDKELPDIEDYCQLIQDFSDYSGRMSGYRTSQQDMLEAGYVATEPLVKKQ